MPTVRQERPAGTCLAENSPPVCRFGRSRNLARRLCGDGIREGHSLHQRPGCSALRFAFSLVTSARIGVDEARCHPASCRRETDLPHHANDGIGRNEKLLVTAIRCPGAHSHDDLDNAPRMSYLVLSNVRPCYTWLPQLSQQVTTTTHDLPTTQRIARTATCACDSPTEPQPQRESAQHSEQ